jgi:hypothetical protein
VKRVIFYYGHIFVSARWPAWICYIANIKLCTVSTRSFCSNSSLNSTESRYKFLSAFEGDKQQLRSFYSACCGMAQVIYAELSEKNSPAN